MTDLEILIESEKQIPYDQSNKYNGPIHWEKHKKKIDKYRETWVDGVLSDTARKHWEPKWIKPEDGLPEIDEQTKTDFGYYSKTVFVLCDGYFPTTSKAFFNNKKEFICFLNPNAPRPKVTHWMPIPNFND